MTKDSDDRIKHDIERATLRHKTKTVTGPPAWIKRRTEKPDLPAGPV